MFLIEDPHKPYDFLINGALLSSSLQEWLQVNNLSAENTISIEVIESVSPPKKREEISQDDWISAVDYNGRTLVGSYDANIRIYPDDLVVKLPQPIKALKWLSDDTFVAGTLDSVLRCFKNDSCLWEGIGHSKSIDALAVSEQYIASGSFDGQIYVWPISPKDADELDEHRDKKRAVCRKIRPLFAFQQSDAVTSLAFGGNTLYSGSMDRGIRCWDLTERTDKHTMSCDHAPLCLAASNGLVATGHADGFVRVWDPSSSTETAKCKLGIHQSWVSDISWSPNSPSQFVTVSYDGLIKIWDIRSTNKAIYTLSPKDKQRLFCVKWTSDDRLLCGGEAGKLLVYTLKQENVGK